VKGCKSVFTRSDNLRSHAREKHGVDCGRNRGDVGEEVDLDAEGRGKKRRGDES